MAPLKNFIAALLIVLAPAAQAQGIACSAPEKPMLRAELYFGLAIAGASSVSAWQWTDFVAKELTTRFPDGLTVLDGQGQWRDEDGYILAEPSKIVIVIAPEGELTRERIAAATAAYKQRFRQKSVLVVTRPVCAEY